METHDQTTQQPGDAAAAAAEPEAAPTHNGAVQPPSRAQRAARDSSRPAHHVRAQAGTDCLCSDPDCDTVAKHPPGVPCPRTACPKCGKPMKRPPA